MSNQLVPMKTKVNTIRELLERSKSQIKLALPKHVSADRLLRVAMTSIQKTPQLLDCSQASLLGAVIQCAQLGLEPDGVLGHAYLIPFKDTVQLIVGYKGLLDLARRSGQVSTAYARVVHERDEFEFEYGLDPKCVHKPSTDEDPGEMTHVYAVIKLRDGSFYFDVMSKAEVDRIRKRSRASGSGPWVTDYEEMAKKTVLRRALKLCPLSVELATAVAIDEKPDANLSQDLDTMIEVKAEDETKKPKGKLDAVVALEREKQEREPGSDDNEEVQE